MWCGAESTFELGFLLNQSTENKEMYPLVPANDGTKQVTLGTLYITEKHGICAWVLYQLNTNNVICMPARDQ